MAVFCSMSNLVLVSQSNVSLPLLLPFLMATVSCQWVTPHLWLPAVCFYTLGIIHITQVHWKKIKFVSCFFFFFGRNSFERDGGLCMKHFCQHVGTNRGNTQSSSWIRRFSMNQCFPVIAMGGRWVGAWRFMNNPCVSNGLKSPS